MRSRAVNTVAVAMVCKAPIAGQSKTRLSPPLTAEQCAGLSACFIQDVASNIASLGGGRHRLRRLYPGRLGGGAAGAAAGGFRLLPQGDGDLGDRLSTATADLLAAGHAGAVLVNSDGPTLPRSILRAAVDAVRSGDNVVLSPALDGGYTLIGLAEAAPGGLRRHPVEHRRRLPRDARSAPARARSLS